MDGSVSEGASRGPSRAITRPSESRAAPFSSTSGTTDVGASVLASRENSEERSERAASEPSPSTASAEKLPTKVPSYAVLSSASEKRSRETDGEQAWLTGAAARAGPVAARQAAAATAPGGVGRKGIRRMGATVRRGGGGRGAGRRQPAARSR